MLLRTAAVANGTGPYGGDASSDPAQRDHLLHEHSNRIV